MTGMWSVSSTDGKRWFKHDGTGWTADEATREAVEQGAGKTVERAPLAEPYTPSSPSDPAGLYLLARYMIPGPHVERGTVPEVPEPDATYPADVVF